VTAWGEAVPSAPTCAPIRLTSADPTTAASATFAIAAACSAVLMPKPTATGRSVALQARHGRNAALAAERVPVMPAIET
jgi:hypothetical protein